MRSGKNLRLAERSSRLFVRMVGLGEPDGGGLRLTNLIYKESSDEQGIGPYAADRAACDAHLTFSGCRSRYFRGADHAACGRIRPVSENQELPLAYVRPAFPGLSFVAGRSGRPDL